VPRSADLRSEQLMSALDDINRKHGKRSMQAFSRSTCETYFAEGIL
jgi:hypothetical protein